MDEDIAYRLLEAKFTVRKRPISIPCAHRPLWRFSVLTLMIDSCRSRVASLEQLQVLNWAIKTVENQDKLLDWLNGAASSLDVVVRRDPSLNRTLELAIAEGIIAYDSTSSDTNLRLKLGPAGDDILKLIWSMADSFVVEKRFFQSLPHKMTNREITTLFPRVPT